MGELIRIGLDTSKHFFQIHGVDASGQAVVRKKLRRSEMERFFSSLSPTEIGLEACGASHYWGRWLTSLGHTVKLLPAQLVKPFVRRGKNDAADAMAIYEAMSRQDMRFVPIKSAQQQADLMLVGMRDRLVHNRTQLVNMIRGYAAEFGHTVATGMAHLPALLEALQAATDLPERAREQFGVLGKDYERLNAEIAKTDAELLAWHRSNECSQRLDKVPGIGPVGAMLLTLKVPDPTAFKCARDFAAFLGLTPTDHSTGGKVRLGGITRAGDEVLRATLVAGATAVVQHIRRTQKGSAWIMGLLARKPPKLVAVAVANKMARIAWKLLRTGESYNPAYASSNIIA